jgi:nucleoside-diphosphate-sugar epimerase
LASTTLAANFPDRVDAVVYLAQSRAYRQFPENARDIFDVNVRSVLGLLEYARGSGVRLFLFGSTANVYQCSQHPITEDHPIEPLSFYARSKRMAELLVESYGDFYQCLVLRFFTIYGPTQKGMLIPSLITKIREGEPILVQGNAGLALSPLYVSDASAVIQAALAGSHGIAQFEVLNVGGEEATDIYHLGVAIGDRLGIHPRFQQVPGPEPGGWVADNSRLKCKLGVCPRVGLSEGLARVVANDATQL